MSDEYGASSGYGGSLVNKSAGDSLTTEGEQRAAGVDDGGDYATGNYPPAGDSTASGGYGSRQSPWDASRHSGAHTPARTGSGSGSGVGTPSAGERGLIDQSTSGGSLGDDLGDARQGRDEGAREAAGRERGYGESWEGREEAREALAARYRGGTEGAR